MFVKNRSSFQPRLARGYLTDTRAALSLNIELVLERRHGVWSRSDARLRDPRPPDIARRILWKSVSVTAAGTVVARSGQRSAVVRLRSPYGGVELRVFGLRRWVPHRGALVASEPEPLANTNLSWGLAFGGTDTVEAGYFPGTELPHPGGPAVYSLNPGGIGFYISEAQAIGKPLPRVEHATSPVRVWSDRPRPAGLAPCPELGGLRVPSNVQVPEDLDGVPFTRELLALQLLTQHHAPLETIFPMKPGDDVLVEGLGGADTSLRVPSSPVRVVVHEGAHAREVPGEVRSIHIDASAELAAISFGHCMAYRANSPPRRVTVADHGSGS